MTTQTQEPDVTKLLSMTDNVVIRDRKYGAARNSGNENREYGRLHKSINELAKEANKFRKPVDQTEA